MVSGVAQDTRLALPKGVMLSRTAEFLNSIGLGFEDYTSKTRIYRLRSQTMPSLCAKMLNERDIPVQVAIGNYDFGICTSDWLQELQARYPASNVVKVCDLEYDTAGIFLAFSRNASFTEDTLRDSDSTVRIVTQYPALAESAAYKMRLKKFRIFPLWGSAEAYLPENADLAVISAADEAALAAMNLRAVRKIADSSACIIAHREGLQTADFSRILAVFSSAFTGSGKSRVKTPAPSSVIDNDYAPAAANGNIWLALADGHQQVHTAAFLEKAGIKMQGYSKDDMRRRPASNMDGVNIKVIRPQDMPQQVANGNFDLAVTGKDWLLDHLYQFPSSPVVELADLGFGRVRVVAVVGEDVPADSIEGIRELIKSGKLTPLRIASEYVNIADKYLRDRHIARYRVIPTWGATEVYLPEDADMLIENTETGQTLARHRLKIIDTLFESTACLIGNRLSLDSTDKRAKIEKLVKIFRSIAG
ncbi:MAG: ATP phosphoribosyltransferase [Dehalococcoidia bacterium]|nr:ATP phosphoribosyltransferase [Dehalococcoidia bacterium]MDD5493405.1 ATP phosphoribosyltransferase [Dehalococcoidia bacterium]